MGREKVYQSWKWMYRQYVIKRLSEQEIAVLANTDQATINRWLHKHKLKVKR